VRDAVARGSKEIGRKSACRRGKRPRGRDGGNTVSETNLFRQPRLPPRRDFGADHFVDPLTSSVAMPRCHHIGWLFRQRGGGTCWEWCRCCEWRVANGPLASHVLRESTCERVSKSAHTIQQPENKSVSSCRGAALALPPPLAQNVPLKPAGLPASDNTCCCCLPTVRLQHARQGPEGAMHEAYAAWAGWCSGGRKATLS